jgi:hypothetical protein
MSPVVAILRLIRLSPLELIEMRISPSRIAKSALTGSLLVDSTTWAAEDNEYSIAEQSSSEEVVNLLKSWPARLSWLPQLP